MIINVDGADRLNGKGDLLLRASTGLHRGRCTYISYEDFRNRAALLQPEVSFDKLCAMRNSTMSEHTKNRWRKRCRHDVHDGDISGTFCGGAFKVIRTMVLNPCMENPTRGGRYRSAR